MQYQHHLSLFASKVRTWSRAQLESIIRITITTSQVGDIPSLFLTR